MKLNEITDLIAIRQYVANSLNNSSIDRGTVKVMNGTLLLLDKKIMSLLQTSEFHNYIEYKNVDAAILEVAKLNNIKSGLVK